MASTKTSSKKIIIAGWIITALCVLFLLFDSIIKILKLDFVLEANVKLGYPESVVLGIGLTLFICTILYLIPTTSVLGAILLTGYLGGATATHVRVGEPFIFPVIFGILVWVGVYLRYSNLREIIPFKKIS